MVNFYRRFLPGIVARTLQSLTNALKEDPKTLEWPPTTAAFWVAKVRPGRRSPVSTPRPERHAHPG
jgi:hypothetical protein